MDELVANKKDNNFYLDQDKYAKYSEEEKTAKNIKNKEAVYYRRIKRYDISTIDGEEKLIAPMKEDNGEIKYYVCYDDLFNILEETHFAVGHGGRTRMLKECNRKLEMYPGHEKDMIGLLKSEDLEIVMHSRKNDENMIEQDKENNVVGNESEGIKKET
ncbi:hypothetical protein HHI36_007975, partial [Cryptolaemus montrouzieri]